MKDLLGEIPELRLVFLRCGIAGWSSGFSIRNKVLSMDVLCLDFRTSGKIHLGDSAILRANAELADNSSQKGSSVADKFGFDDTRMVTVDINTLNY